MAFNCFTMAVGNTKAVVPVSIKVVSEDEKMEFPPMLIELRLTAQCGCPETESNLQLKITNHVIWPVYLVGSIPPNVISPEVPAGAVGEACKLYQNETIALFVENFVARDWKTSAAELSPVNPTLPCAVDGPSPIIPSRFAVVVCMLVASQSGCPWIAKLPIVTVSEFTVQMTWVPSPYVTCWVPPLVAL